MKYIDDLDNKRFVDKASGNSLLFTFEDRDHLTIDIDSSQLDPNTDPEDKVYLPLNVITINIKTGKLEPPTPK